MESGTGERARHGTLAVVGGRVVVEAADAGGRAPLLDWEVGVVVQIDGLPPVSRPCNGSYAPSPKREAARSTVSSRDPSVGMAMTLHCRTHGKCASGCINVELVADPRTPRLRPWFKAFG